MATKLCPSCGGALAPVGERTGGFSGTKAVVGAVVAGPLGIAAGALGKKLITMQCEKCGYTLETNAKDAEAAQAYGTTFAPLAAIKREIIINEMNRQMTEETHNKTLEFNNAARGVGPLEEEEEMRSIAWEKYLTVKEDFSGRMACFKDEEIARAIITCLSYEPIDMYQLQDMLEPLGPDSEAVKVSKNPLIMIPFLSALGDTISYVKVWRNYGGVGAGPRRYVTDDELAGRLENTAYRLADRRDMESMENALSLAASAKTFEDFTDVAEACRKRGPGRFIRLADLFDELANMKAGNELSPKASEIFAIFEDVEWGPDSLLLAEQVKIWIKQAKEIQQQNEAWKKAGLCQHCGGQMSGLFGKKCKACGKPA